MGKYLSGTGPKLSEKEGGEWKTNFPDENNGLKKSPASPLRLQRKRLGRERPFSLYFVKTQRGGGGELLPPLSWIMHECSNTLQVKML